MHDALRRTTPLLLALGLCLTWGCHRQGGGAILAPGKTGYGEKVPSSGAGALMEELRRAPGASFHLLYVVREHPAQRLDGHDAVLFVMHGKLALNLDGTAFILGPGDVVEIPRGTQFAAKNMAADASRAYLVITPPLSSSQTVVMEAPSAKRESAWRWTRWGQ